MHIFYPIVSVVSSNVGSRYLNFSSYLLSFFRFRKEAIKDETFV